MSSIEESLGSNLPPKEGIVFQGDWSTATSRVIRQGSKQHLDDRLEGQEHRQAASVATRYRAVSVVQT